MDFIYEKQTEKDFQTAVQDLKENLKKMAFGVLWEVNLKDKLREKGEDFNTDFMVLEVCNPAKANIVLSNTIEAGYMLPCKMAVYQKGSAVWIGMQNPLQLITMMQAQDLQDVAQEVFTALSQAIEESV